MTLMSVDNGTLDKHTLFIPASLLKQGINTVNMPSFELSLDQLWFNEVLIQLMLIIKPEGVLFIVVLNLFKKVCFAPEK